MAAQHSHVSTPFTVKKFPVIVVTDGLKSPANIGSLFRICDAFGVSGIVFGNKQPDLTSPRLKRTARNTHKNVPHRVSENIIGEIQEMKRSGYTILVLELTDKSIPIEKLTIASEAIALVIGGESHGISEEMLREASETVHIEMFGNNSSMNVVQATAIALYSLTKLL